MLEWARAPLCDVTRDRRPVHGYRRAGGRAGGHRPDARVIAVDDSEEALRYARRNVEGTAVELVRADVTEPGLLPELDGRVDLWWPTRPIFPTAPYWNPKWPNMIRRTRCSAARTGWR